MLAPDLEASCLEHVARHAAAGERLTSSATLALNAGEKFRRGLLLMLSLHVSPLFADRSQGRVFTHRRVQISGATFVVQRRNKNVAAAALASKNARIVWALLARDRRDETGYRKAAEVA